MLSIACTSTRRSRSWAAPVHSRQLTQKAKIAASSKAPVQAVARSGEVSPTFTDLTPRQHDQRSNEAATSTTEQYKKRILFSPFVSPHGETKNDLITTSTKALPTAAPDVLQPRKRPLPEGLGIIKVTHTRDHLLEAIAAMDVRKAWFIYKRLHDGNQGGRPQVKGAVKMMLQSGIPPSKPARFKPAVLPEVHRQMLQLLQRHSRPAIAARQASMVADNITRILDPTGLGRDMSHWPPQDLRALMVCHLRNSDPARAVVAYDRVNRCNCNEGDFKVKDRLSALLLMTAFAQSGRPEAAARAWSALVSVFGPAAGLDEEAYGTMIAAYSHPNIRDLTAVKKLIYGGWVPGTPVFASGKSVEDIMASHVEAPTRMGRASRIVADASVRALGVCGDLEGAMDLFYSGDPDRQHAKAGSQPGASWEGYRDLGWSLWSFDAALEGLEVQGDVSGAEALWVRMIQWIEQQNRIAKAARSKYYRRNARISVPKAEVAAFLSDGSSVSIRSLLNDTSEDEAPPSLDTQTKGLRPLAVSYKRMMRLYKSYGDQEKLMSIFEAYQNVRIPDGEAFETIVRSFLARGELLSACKIYKENIVDGGWAPGSDLVREMATAEESARFLK